MKNIKIDNNWKIIFGLVALFLVLYLIWFFRVIIAYALIAVVISFIGDPVMHFLKRIRIKNWHMPSWMRAIVTLLSFFSVFGLLVYLFAPLVNREIQILMQIDPNQVADNLQYQVTQVQDAVGAKSDWMNRTELTKLIVEKGQSLMNFSWVSSAFENVFSLLSSFIIGVFAVLFMSFFFLKDGLLFTRIVFTLTPDEHIEKVKNVMEHTHRLLSRYFIGICVQSLIMATMVGVSLWILGIQNALLIGLFAGLVNVVPYVGPLLGATFGLFVALSTGLSVGVPVDLMSLSIKVLVVFLAAQQIDGFIIQPLVLGSSVKAHPLEIFVVVLAAGTIGGVLGMILAIPAYTILRVIAAEFLDQFKVVESLTRDLTEE